MHIKGFPDQLACSRCPAAPAGTGETGRKENVSVGHPLKSSGSLGRSGGVRKTYKTKKKNNEAPT